MTHANSSDPALQAEVETLRQQVAQLLAAETQRQQAEAALRESETRFRALIENAIDLIGVLDASGTILYASPSTTKALGYPSGSGIGRHFLEFVPSEQIPMVQEAFQHALRQPGVSIHVPEFHVRHLNGSVRMFEAYTTNLLHDPAVNGIVVNCHDITERKRLEEQLLHAQKMESIGRLAGGIAHDFNNLLTAILGYAELSREELHPDNSVYNNIQQIEQAVERAAALTRQLLAFARRQVIEPRVLNINDLIMGLEPILRRLLHENITLAVRLRPHLWAVQADSGQIEQALINLVVNARDAMPEGGTLHIETDNVTLRAEIAALDSAITPGDYVVLAVSDTGVGMEEAVRERIFEPFFTTKPQGKGSGMGLATVYGIIRQSGGHIQVSSAPGNGTTFKLYLRRVLAPVEEAPVSPSARAPIRGNETILLAEDEPQVRAIAARLLREWGYIVLEARDGLEALRATQPPSRPIQLLITDMMMPNLGGVPLAEQLRQTHPGLKVLYISGYADSALSENGWLRPDMAYLQKPFTPLTLALKVREILDE